MTITPEVRERIFALYYGQPVHKTPLTGDYWIGIVGKNEIEEGDFLELKSLSAISDEDAIEVSRIFTDGADAVDEDRHLSYGKYNAGFFAYKSVCSDFLRSRGYAVSAFGFSVEHLVEAGIFKLTNK